MKFFYLAIFLCFAVVFNSLSQDKTEYNYKRYHHKTAKIEYRISGKTSGKEVLYFKDYGRTEAKYNESVLEMGNGDLSESHYFTLIKDQWAYNINLKENSGTKSKSSLHPFFAEVYDSLDIDKALESYFQEIGGEIIGTDTILGKKCNVWEMKKYQGKIWIWENIPLKNEYGMAEGSVSTVATKIEVNIDIPDKVFDIPENISIYEIK